LGISGKEISNRKNYCK